MVKRYVQSWQHMLHERTMSESRKHQVIPRVLRQVEEV